ncbi:MAG: polymer-forming cytoskeletal protein [Burkholderiaceae bacterium]|jgi:cytoskeletal protein CcmA (bactofilin family)|nr:polymer-forming cytoskeletal protein [Burkholderiaceae bacterium]
MFSKKSNEPEVNSSENSENQYTEATSDSTPEVEQASYDAGSNGYSNGNSGRSNPTKPSIISEGFEFVGTITSDGVLNISGVIKGKVTAKSVLVDSTGLVEGELFSDQVMVKGKVLGDINCDELNIGPLAEVDGSVSYDSVHIQRGGKIKGHFIKK